MGFIKNKKYLSKGNLNREILLLAVPNIISNLSVPLLGIADFALMGHLKAHSTVYVGAIALGTTIFNVLYMSFGFLRMGTSGFTSQAYGAGNKEELGLTLQRSLAVALAFAFLLIILQYPIQWISFHLLDGTEQVKSLAREYFYIRIFAAPATLSLYSFYGWFLGMQNAKTPMFIAILVNIVNICLNFFFVYAIKMNSNGVALASVLAQYSGLMLAVWFLLKKYPRYSSIYSIKLLLKKSAIKKFFQVNGDIFIRTVLLILTLSFFTSQSAKMGNNILAVNSLLFQFFFFFSYFADGFAFAGEALTGKAKGLKSSVLLKKTIDKLHIWGFGIAILTTLLYWWFLPLFMKIMTNNEILQSLSSNYFIWVILLPVTSIAAFIWDGIYIGVTESKPMRNTMIISSLFIFLPVFYLTFPKLGNNALWLSLVLFMVSRGLGLFLLSKKHIFKTT